MPVPSTQGGTPFQTVSTDVPSLSEAVYKACFDSSPAAQVILGNKGELLESNAQACAVLGFERADLLGKRLTDLVHPDDQAAMYAAISLSMRRNEPFEIECRSQQPGQDMRWFVVQSRPVELAPHGTLWYTLLADITERKMQEAWLTHRNVLLTALSNNLPGMIYVFRPGPDKGGRLDFVSEGVRQLFGTTPEEALASPWVLYNRVPPEDLSQFFQQRDKAVSESSRLHSEFRVRNAQGELRWCAADSIAGVDKDGNEVRCGYIADITEHKLYQEARMAAETAERASRAKSQFLSRMSHELRTPLNAMLGFAQLLRVDAQHPLSEPQRKKVDHIEKAGAHLLAMLTDVLDLSRIEAGSLPMQCQAMPVAPVMDEAADLVAHQVREAQLRLHITPAPADWRLLGDPVRVRQVLSLIHI